MTVNGTEEHFGGEEEGRGGERASGRTLEGGGGGGEKEGDWEKHNSEDNFAPLEVGKSTIGGIVGAYPVWVLCV